VPLDGFKAEIKGDVKNHLINVDSGLVFAQRVDTRTGEIVRRKSKTGQPKKDCLMAIERGLRFRYYPESHRMFLQGSFHKFFNEGYHNYDSYSSSKFLKTLKIFKQEFKIHPENIDLQSLEWGVNITPPAEVHKVVNSLVMHKWSPFESSVYESTSRQSTHNEYAVKVYSKNGMNLLDRKKLRIEIKQLRWKKYCRKNGISSTLKDLLDSNFIGLNHTLKEAWQSILFFDPEIPTTNQEVTKYRDPKFWDRGNFSNRNQRIKMFNELRKINSNLGGDLQGRILSQIDNELITNSTQGYT
jgi:hypothetical protein